MMKKIKFNRLVSMVALVLFCSCGKAWQPLPERIVTIVLDCTNEQHLSTITNDLPELEEALRLDADPWAGVTVRVVTLGSLIYHPAIELSLAAENPNQGFQSVRNRKVAAFKLRLREVILAIVNQPRTEEASIVFLPIWNQLEELSTNPGHSRELVVFSDMLDLNPAPGALSMYDDIVLKRLEEEPAALTNHYLGKKPVLNLQGVRCSLISVAKNTPNSFRVHRAASIYRRLLEPFGAEVFVAGNYIHRRE